MLTEMAGGQLFINMQIKYFSKHPEVFEGYMQQFEPKNFGMKRAENTVHSLIPDFEKEVIDNLNDVTFERYVEWQVADTGKDIVVEESKDREGNPVEFLSS